MKMKKRSDIIEFLTCLFFPNRCIFCGSLMPPNEESLCDECRETLPWIQGKICLRCGAAKNDCKCGGRQGGFYDGLAAVFYYDDTVRECIHRFKFNSDRFASVELAELMSQTCAERYSDIKFDYVAYVPMERKRQRRRGYNQSRLLAQYISANLNLPFGDKLIEKVYHTEIQHKQSEIERRGNLLGAFDINPKYDVTGKTVLLVDDVKTSGATVNECGKMLYLRGAKAVFCLTTALVNSKMNNSEKTEMEDVPC